MHQKTTKNKFPWLLIAAATTLLAAVIIGSAPDIGQMKLITAGEDGVVVPGNAEFLKWKLELNKKSLGGLERLLLYYQTIKDSGYALEGVDYVQKIKETQKEIKDIKVKIKAIEERLMELDAAKISIENLPSLLGEIMSKIDKFLPGMQKEEKYLVSKVGSLSEKQLEKEIEELGQFNPLRLIKKKQLVGRRALSFIEIMLTGLEETKQESKSLKKALENATDEEGRCKLTRKGKEEISSKILKIIGFLRYVREGVRGLLSNAGIRESLGVEGVEEVENVLQKIESYIRQLGLYLRILK